MSKAKIYTIEHIENPKIPDKIWPLSKKLLNSKFNKYPDINIKRPYVIKVEICSK